MRVCLAGEQAITSAQDAARVCTLAGSRGAEQLDDIKHAINVYQEALSMNTEIKALNKTLRKALRRGDKLAALRVLLASGKGVRGRTCALARVSLVDLCLHITVCS